VTLGRKLSQRAKRLLVPTHQQLVRKAHELRYLFLELTQDCNLRCLHCGSDCTRDPTASALDAEDILRVLREVKAHHDSHRISIALTGGEPLCYPDLFDLGREIYRLEFPWGMVTNGYAWSAQKVEEAKGAGLHTITVSLDGLEQEHDWLRGRPGSHRKAVEAISMLLDAGFLQALDVITCANPRNVHKLRDIYEQLAEIGVTNWRIFTISPIGRATDNEALFLSPADYHLLMDVVADLRRDGRIRMGLSESGYHGPQHEFRVRGEYFFCRAGINVAGIMCNGDILACPNIDRRLKQGNIHDDSFIEVWEQRYQQFRDRRWMKQGPCASCDHWRMCQGNSFHLWDLDRNQTKLCHCQRFELL
jgi:radical SAM enzyme (rSAM/lipoprotein system)